MRRLISLSVLLLAQPLPTGSSVSFALLFLVLFLLFSFHLNKRNRCDSSLSFKALGTGRLLIFAKMLFCENPRPRAQIHGWENTYTFTKGMGETVIRSNRGELPIVIIRPSIIESSSDLGVWQRTPSWILRRSSSFGWHCTYLYGCERSHNTMVMVSQSCKCTTILLHHRAKVFSMCYIIKNINIFVKLQRETQTIKPEIPHLYSIISDTSNWRHTVIYPYVQNRRLKNLAKFRIY